MKNLKCKYKTMEDKKDNTNAVLFLAALAVIIVILYWWLFLMPSDFSQPLK